MCHESLAKRRGNNVHKTGMSGGGCRPTTSLCKGPPIPEEKDILSEDIANRRRQPSAWGLSAGGNMSTVNGIDAWS